MIRFLSFLEYVLGFILRPFFFKRFRFECEHRTKGFKASGLKAHYCFEFSSEGELARIRYRIKELIKTENSLVELIFCSPSVLHEVKNLKKEFPNNIEYIAYPFFYRKVSLKKWVTSSHLGLIRYDFFPRLLDLGIFTCYDFELYSASAKNLKKAWVGKIYLYLFKKFSKIFAASKADALDLSIALDRSVEFKEYRIDEIRSRQSEMARNKKILDSFTSGKALLSFLEQGMDTSRSIILGSFWLEEMDVKEVSELILDSNFSCVCIFPHDLSEVKKCFDFFSKVGKALIINQKTTLNEKNLLEYKFLIFNVKGVLCEMYPFFQTAYVGGAYSKGLHSVLEPGVANVDLWISKLALKSSQESEVVLVRELSGKILSL